MTSFSPNESARISKNHLNNNNYLCCLSRVHTKCWLYLTELRFNLSYSIQYYSMMVLFTSAKINRLGRTTSQSKVKNKMPWLWCFTAMLDLEARRKEKEVSKARRRKIRCLKQQQRTRQFLNTLHRLFLGLFCPIRVSCCAWCFTHVALPLHSLKRWEVWFPQITMCPPFCSITHCNYF